MYDHGLTKGSEFLRKARKVARAKKLSYNWVPKHGRGSHGTLYIGADGITTVQYLPREIPTGTLRAMIEELKLDPKDFGIQ